MKTPRIALSMALAAVAMIFAQKANALVRLDGAFVPTQCGQQQIVRDGSAPVPAVDIQQVCVGQITGSKDVAVVFRLANGEEQLFHVNHTANYLMALQSGDIKSMFYLVNDNGQTTSMKVIRTRQGLIKSVAGTLNDITYLVPEMEMIFSIQ
jgi:hypothetical protein